MILHLVKMGVLARKAKVHNSPVNVHPALRVIFVTWMSLSALLSLVKMEVLARKEQALSILVPAWMDFQDSIVWRIWTTATPLTASMEALVSKTMEPLSCALAHLTTLDLSVGRK